MYLSENSTDHGDSGQFTCEEEIASDDESQDGAGVRLQEAQGAGALPHCPRGPCCFSPPVCTTEIGADSNAQTLITLLCHQYFPLYLSICTYLLTELSPS
jgi:hypothetical protein